VWCLVYCSDVLCQCWFGYLGFVVCRVGFVAMWSVQLFLGTILFGAGLFGFVSVSCWCSVVVAKVVGFVIGFVVSCWFCG